MRRLFRRLKKDDGTEEEVEVPTEAEAEPTPGAEAEPTPEAAGPPATAVPTPVEESPPEQEVVLKPASGTIPYHSNLTDRLLYLFNDSMTQSQMAGPDEFTIEFMAMGERFWIRKSANGPIEHGVGAIPDEDVFVRVSDTVTQELLSAATFDEFIKVYMEHYKNPGPGKFVKVELRKDVSSLNRMGYARVQLLKLIIGSVR